MHLLNPMPWIVACFAPPALAQFGPQNIISTLVDQATDVEAADLDGDGDLDVLATASNGNQVSWFENLDGQGSFGPAVVISSVAFEALDVLAADLDGDGDEDVVWAAGNADRVAWHRNNGTGQFTGPLDVTLPGHVDEPITVYAADLDGDGDVDILSASANDDRVAWYPNLDGLGTFGVQRIITTAVDEAESVHAADIDGDGDLDALSASSSDGKVAWYSNQGGNPPLFGPQQLIASTPGAGIVSTADMDGDGDPDVLSAAAGTNAVIWNENLGGGVFGPPLPTHPAGDPAGPYCTADVDADGDLDIVIVAAPDAVTWYENTNGLGAFGPRQIISTSALDPSAVTAADIDGDGDLDLLSASELDDKVAWYPNLSFIGSRYCIAAPNSTGRTGALFASGQALAAANDLRLIARHLPESAFGYFLTSRDSGFVSNPGGSSGNLCLGGAIGRYVGPGEIRNSGATGSFSLVIDLTQVPQPTGAVAALSGDVWRFQAWHRDVVGGVPTSNFTSGLEILLL